MTAVASRTVSAADACVAGMKAQEAGNVSRAIACFEHAVAAAPSQIDIRLLLAFAVAGDGQKLRAQQVLADTPSMETMHVMDLRKLADAAVQIGNVQLALRITRLLIAGAPDDADLHSTLGTLLQNTGAMEEAGHVLHKASMRWPQHIPASLNYARWLVADGSYAAALNGYDRALAIAPRHHAARWHRGMLRLMMGDFAGGWSDCEARRMLPVHTVNVPVTMPAWDGRNAHGKTLLLWGEQGLGDQIQGVRFAANLAALGATVVVRAANSLRSLFEAAPGVAKVVGPDDALPKCDAHVPMLSVPYLLKLNTDSDYESRVYLGNDVARSKTFAPATSFAQHRESVRTRVGIVWAGSPGHTNDANRSLSSKQMASLLQHSQVQWISLQAGARAADLQQVPAFLRPNIIDAAPTLTNFVDTAHVLSALDRVVTVDTAVAHLAGAMGVPTLLLVPFVPDWRWQLAREDSPWYDSVRIIRQTSAGDWSGVISRVRRELSAGGQARAA